MKSKIYAIHDVKADAFGNPIFQANDAMATRSLAGAINDPASLIGQNPEDFNLYRLGEYDNETGLIEPEAKPKLVCSAVSVSMSLESKEERKDGDN